MSHDLENSAPSKGPTIKGTESIVSFDGQEAKSLGGNVKET